MQTAVGKKRTLNRFGILKLASEQRLNALFGGRVREPPVLADCIATHVFIPFLATNSTEAKVEPPKPIPKVPETETKPKFATTL